MRTPDSFIAIPSPCVAFGNDRDGPRFGLPAKETSVAGHGFHRGDMPTLLVRPLLRRLRRIRRQRQLDGLSGPRGVIDRQDQLERLAPLLAGGDRLAVVQDGVEEL